MSLSGWRIARLRFGSFNFSSLDQLLNAWQKLSAGPSRSISVTTVERLSVKGAHDGGPREPVEESAVQDKEVPEATGDKRLWRKWIEERLAHSKAGGEEKFPTATASSFFEDDATKSTLYDTTENEERSSSPRSSVKSLYARSQPTEDDVIAPPTTQFVDRTAREWESSADLEDFIDGNLKPSTFSAAGTSGVANFGSIRNQFKRDSPTPSFVQDTEPSSRSTTKQSSLFQENTKRSSASSAATQKASGTSSQTPVDIQRAKVEALDDFEHRVLGTASDMDDRRDDDFLRELDEIGRSARGIRDFDYGEEESAADEDEDWDDEKAQVLTDLALSNLEEFDLEDEEHPYRLRADRLFFPGQTYDPEDLDISKPVTELEKPTTRTRKNYSSKEICQIADFRNPRYLSNFIRESSRILPRRHHRVSAKAQRRIAREIKTARILGLMPFTSMGDPPFRFLRS